MDVLRLNETTYMPEEGVITGYSSMIWTERYREPGDFKMVTPRVEETRDLLPEGTFITHRQTDDVMMVETHSIDEKGMLTVVGRSLDAFLENRYIEGAYKKKFKMAQKYSYAEAAVVLLWNTIVNETGFDVLRAADWPNSLSDVLPNAVVTNSIPRRFDTLPRRRWLTEGPAYPQLDTFLLNGGLGIRIIRPESNNGDIITVSHRAATRGVITRAKTNGIKKLRFDIYQGEERQKGSDNAVIFYGPDIEKPEHLWSIKDYKTLAKVVSSVGKANVYQQKATDKEKKGWDLRILHVDAGEPGEPDNGETKAETKAEFKEDLPDFGAEALKAHRKTRLFNGAVSPLASQRYNEHYYLGDTVSLIGRYKIEAEMVVSEYVRIHDNQGDRGYPGLVVAED